MREVKLTIRIREDLKKMVEDVAKREGLSLNAIVNYLFGRIANKGRVNIDDCSEEIKQVLTANQAVKYTIIERIEKVLNFFGFTKEEYPLVFATAGIDNISYADIYDSKRLVEKLNTSAIKQLAQLFDINTEFLYGRTENIVKFVKEPFYKNFYNFTKEYYTLLSNTVNGLQSTLYISFTKPPTLPLAQDDSIDTGFALILEVPVARIDSGKVIYRYYVDNSHCYWDYWRCRHHLYILLCYLLSLGLPSTNIQLMHRKEDWSTDDFVKGHVAAEEFLSSNWNNSVFFDVITEKHENTIYKLPIIVPSYNRVDLERAEKEAMYEVRQVFKENKDIITQDIKKLEYELFGEL